MRASRLLSILTTLQARGRVTAPVLAESCEVSLRTIYRDIDALSAAGIPVYSERGSEGGYRLLDGYRTRLNGLKPREAEALFLTGLAGPAADLGLGAAMAAAQLKLLVALPEELRAGAERMQACFHLDAPAWFAEAEQPAHLPAIANAVWDRKRLRLRYESWKGERDRLVEPLGLVLKSGAWYLVGQVDGTARTYRIGRIRTLELTEEGFERPESFDLAGYWRRSTRRLEEDLRRNQATIRLSPLGMKMLEHVLSPYDRAGMRIEDTPDEAGWRKATLPIGSLYEATADLLRLGAEVEVLDPPALRARMAETVQAMGWLYGAK
jgi:predicted DNA-binding transcriptional regulator YafY